MADSRQKKINIEQTVGYLNFAFDKAQQKAQNNKDLKGKPLRDFQVEFCYLIHEITRGPNYIIPKLIAQTNELIDKLTALTEKKQK